MSINKYKKKPIIIEAVQWTGINLKEIKSFVGDSLDYNYKTHGDSSDLSNIEVKIKTLEGDHIASIGDYIIKGVNGEFYPCKPDIFKKTYESATLTLQNEWVSVEEKLPENNTQVLMWSARWKIAEAGSYYNKHFWVYSEIGDGYIADNITHWMSLPEPPEKEE